MRLRVLLEKLWRAGFSMPPPRSRVAVLAPVAQFLLSGGPPGCASEHYVLGVSRGWGSVCLYATQGRVVITGGSLPLIRATARTQGSYSVRLFVEQPFQVLLHKMLEYADIVGESRLLDFRMSRATLELVRFERREGVET